MPFVSLSGRGQKTVVILKVLQQCGLAKSDRAALMHFKRREIYLNGEQVLDKKTYLKVDDRYTIELRLPGAVVKKMDVIVVEYPYHGYIRRHSG